MILTLEVSGPQAASLGAAGRRVFSTNGGVIGRATKSDWVLPHTKVSSRHAVISYLDGIFYIEDTSTNGVCINSPKNRVLPGRRYALQSGDRIFIDPYEINVAVSSEREAPGVVDPFGVDDPFGSGPASGQTPRLTPPRRESTPEPVPAEELDPLRLLGSEPRSAPPRKAVTAQELESRSAVEGHYQPPAVVTPSPSPAAAGPILIPADYDPLRDDFTEPPTPPPHIPVAPVLSSSPHEIESPRATPPPAPQTPAAQPVTSIPVTAPAQPSASPPRHEHESMSAQTPGSESTAGLDALLRGAGLENVQPTPELARSFGQIFRVVVAGVMDVLRSRSQIKDEFRIRLTQFRPAENNPLKFSANVDDALHNLLVKRNPAYLEPVRAFEDAFEDLRNHQLAMLAGMRVAFESMLAEFDPDRLENQFARQLKRVPLLRAIARLRYWDLYRDRRDEIAKDPDESFKKLFGEQFARAYEEQLSRLKTESRGEAANKNIRPSDI